MRVQLLLFFSVTSLYRVRKEYMVRKKIKILRFSVLLQAAWLEYTILPLSGLRYRLRTEPVILPEWGMGITACQFSCHLRVMN